MELRDNKLIPSARKQFSDLKEVQTTLGLPKNVFKLTLHELIESIIKWNNTFDKNKILPDTDIEQLKLILPARNACVHGRYADINIDEIENYFTKIFILIFNITEHNSPNSNKI